MVGRRTAAGLGAAALAGVLSGCGHDAAGGEDSSACQGAKCDALDGSGTSGTSQGDSGSGGSSDGGTTGEPSAIDEACWDRRTEAFNPNRLSFTETALRWSCSDIDSTPATARGQEYCEYFAIALPPPTPSTPQPDPSVLGRNLGVDPDAGQTPFVLELDGEQVAALEGSPDAIVGACVFSSWDADIDAPCGDDCGAPDVLGVPVTTDTFRMKFDPNTNEAALALVDDCTQYLPTLGDPADPDDPYHDPFFRACHLNADVNETEYRKSDNVICSASVRLAECGCGLASGGPLAEGIAPPADLGFRLGTWSDAEGLPPGCRYHDVVEDAHTLVICDLTAAEVLQYGDDLKSYCRDSFADDVVVHVAIPGDAIVCNPPAGEPYADDCPAHPWVLQP